MKGAGIPEKAHFVKDLKDLLDAGNFQQARATVVNESKRRNPKLSVQTAREKALVSPSHLPESLDDFTISPWLWNLYGHAVRKDTYPARLRLLPLQPSCFSPDEVC